MGRYFGLLDQEIVKMSAAKNSPVKNLLKNVGQKFWEKAIEYAF